MSVSLPNRRARRRSGASTPTRSLAAAGAVITTAALTAGVSAPAANAAVYNSNITLAATEQVDFTTTGPLFGLLSALGFNSIPFVVENPVPLDLNFNLDWVMSNPQLIYNALNAIPLAPTPEDAIVCSGSENDQCRFTGVVAGTLGAVDARNALDALWSAANRQIQLPGYTPLPVNSVGSLIGETNLLSVFVNNPLRPNGGLAARFGSFLNILGININLPNTGTSPVDAKPTEARVNNSLFDITWEYNPFADFPVTLNPFSLLNSALAALPPSYLLSTPVLDILKEDMAINTITENGDAVTPPGDPKVFDTFGLSVLLALQGGASVGQLFGTLVNPDLPLLAPLRLPAQLINTVLDRLAAAFAPPGSAGLPFRLGTPIADILQPALKILVNIGYADVVTPNDIAVNPKLSAWGEYGRTFAQVPIQFGTVSPLTPQEMLQVPGDVLNALVTGITQQLAKPFFGIIEPAPCVGCTPTAAVTPPVAATVPAPSAAVAAEEIAAEPVADPAPTAVTALAGESAAEAVSAVSEVRAVRQSRAARAPAAATSVRGEATAAAAEKDAGDSPARNRAARAGR